MKKLQTGFTLIEVLVVIFILSIIVTAFLGNADDTSSTESEIRVIQGECEDGELVAYVDDEQVVIGSSTKCEEQNQSSNSSWSN